MTQLNILNVKSGKLVDGSAAKLQQYIHSYTTDDKYIGKPLVIFIHGAGVQNEKVGERIDEYVAKYALNSENCFPIFITWNSGVWEVIGIELDDFKKEVKIVLEREDLGFIQKFKELIRVTKENKIANFALRTVGKLLAKRFKKALESNENAQAIFEDIDVDIDKYLEIPEELESIELLNQYIEDDTEGVMLSEYGGQSIEELEELLAQDDEFEKYVNEDQELGSMESPALIKFLANVVAKVLVPATKRFIKKTNHQFYETILEEVLRALAGDLLKVWWDSMKEQIEEGFETGQEETSVGTALLQIIDQNWDKITARGGSNPVYLVSASAGTIFGSEFIGRMEELNIRKMVKFNLVYFIPAVSIKRFEDKVMQHQDRVNEVYLWALNDRGERKDNTIKFYTSSILYFISGLLEEEVDMPLLGMERFYLNKKPYKLNRTKNAYIRKAKEYIEPNIQWFDVDRDGIQVGDNTYHDSFTINQGILEKLLALINPQDTTNIEA